MNRITKVALPVNVTPEELGESSAHLSYPRLKPTVKYIKNAFITSTGLVCSQKGFVKESCHYDWDQQPDVCFAQACQFYYDSKEDPDNLMIFDDQEIYLVIHHVWFHNYFHWLNESLYRLWLVKDSAEHMILLLPPLDALPQFALDSLKLFKFKNIIHIPDKKSALVRTLCLPSQKPLMSSYNSNAMAALNKLYVNAACSVKVDVKERVYISRKNASRRKIINEDEVIATLINYNFSIIQTENHTLFDQVALFSKVKYLIESHGAGMTNMLFMNPGATVFELLKRKTNPTRHQNLLFWYMADAMGHNYYHQICEPINHNELFFTADITVDIGLLNKNLQLMLSTNNSKA